MTLEEEVVNLWFAEVEDESHAPVEMTISRIAHETGLATGKVRTIIFGEDETGTDPSCPYYMKKYHGDVVPVKKYSEIKGQLFLKTEATALTILQRGLKKHLDSPDDMTISELKDLTGMITQLDKINRLEDGKPTEIIKSTNYTPKRIIEIIESDPMYGGKRKMKYEEEEKDEKENTPRRIDSGDVGEGTPEEEESAHGIGDV